MGKRYLNFEISGGILFLVFASLGLYIVGKQIPHQIIVNFVQSAGPFAPAAFILIYISQIIIAPINGIPYLIAAFYLFGNSTIFYVYIASAIGYTLNFLIAKKWGRPVVAKLAGADALSKLDKVEKDYGFWTLVFMRLFMMGLGDFISYGYGLTTMKLVPFLLVTYIAMIPSHMLWYFLAIKTNNIEEFIGLNIALTWTLGGIFVSGLFIVNIMKKISKR